MHYRAISADNHFNEPGDVFLKHLPERLKGRAPRLVSIDGGGESWQFDGVMAERRIHSLDSMVFLRGRIWKPEEFKVFPVRHSELAPGSYEPKAAVQAMAEDGVDASVWYPGLGTAIYATQDKELRLALARAYNDWQAEFSSHDPNRLVTLAVLPTEEETPDEAVAGLARALDMGFRGVIVPMFSKRRFWDRWWDPLWAAAQEADIAVHFHKGVGPRIKSGAFGDRTGPGMFCAGQVQSDYTYSVPVADFIFGGVFDRFPELKIVSGEGRLGWLLHFVERGDVSYKRQRFHQGLELKKLPSDYVKHNVYSTFLEDRIAILNREFIGTDNQMWSSDYPHSDSTWPESQQINDEQFIDVPEEVKRKVLVLNAAKLYRLPADG